MFSEKPYYDYRNGSILINQRTQLLLELRVISMPLANEQGISDYELTNIDDLLGISHALISVRLRKCVDTPLNYPFGIVFV